MKGAGDGTQTTEPVQPDPDPSPPDPEPASPTDGPPPDDDRGEGAHDDPPASEAPSRPSLARRLAPLLGALVAAALLSPLAERWPSTHELELALDDPRDVRAVELTVSREGEPIHATTWSWAEGDAPPRVRTTIRGPDGDYRLEIAVDRGGGPAHRRPQTLSLDGRGVAVVHLR